MPRFVARKLDQPFWLGIVFVLSTPCRNDWAKDFNCTNSFCPAASSICLTKLGASASARMDITVITPIISIKLKARLFKTGQRPGIPKRFRNKANGCQARIPKGFRNKAQGCEARIPKGFCNKAQGCEQRATLGNLVRPFLSTSKRLRQLV